MCITGIALEATSRSPIVLLSDPAGRRQVPIWIDQMQAINILQAMRGKAPPRPMTHDLIMEILKVGHLQLDRVVIHAIENNTFHAVLQLRMDDGSEHALDCRSSDAIALALLSRCGIWMLEEVVSNASMPVDADADAEDTAEFRRFIDQVSPAELIRRAGLDRTAEDSQGDDNGEPDGDSPPPAPDTDADDTP